MSVIIEALLYLATGTFYWWWTQHFTVFGLAPDFIFAAALSAAILSGPVKGIAWGFFLGLYADMLGAGPIGGYALTYTLMAYTVHLVKHQFDMDGFFSQIVAAISLSWVCMLFYMGLSLAFARLNPLGLKIFLAGPFLNALAVPLVFQVFYRMKRRFGVL